MSFGCGVNETSSGVTAQISRYIPMSTVSTPGSSFMQNMEEVNESISIYI